MTLDETRYEEFDHQGYVVVKDIVSLVHLSRMRRLVAGVERRHERLPPYLRSRVGFQETRNATLSDRSSDERPKLASMRDATLFGAPFEDLLFLRPLLDVVEALLGGCEFSFRYAGLGIRLGSHASSKAEAFHREADPRMATEPKGLIAILPIENMDASNGATRFVRDSHRLSDQEAMEAARYEKFEPREDEVITPTVEAGSALFFGYKVLHAAGPMLQDAPPRRTLLMDWLAPGVLPTTFGRRAYDGIRPGSQMPEFQKQLAMSFPWRFGGRKQTH